MPVAIADVLNGPGPAGTNFKVKGCPLVCHGVYGRDFFRGVMSPDQASLHSRNIFTVLAISPSIQMVNIRLNLPLAIFRLKLASGLMEEESYMAGRCLEMAVGDELYIEQIYSNATNDWVYVSTTPRGFRVSITSVTDDRDLGLSSTPLLDSLLMDSCSRDGKNSTGSSDKKEKKKGSSKPDGKKKGKASRQLRLERYAKLIRAVKRTPHLAKKKLVRRKGAKKVETAISTKDLALFRRLLRARPSLLSSYIPMRRRLMMRVKTVRLLRFGKKSSEIAWMSGVSDCRQNYDPYDLSMLAKHNRPILEKESGSKMNYRIAVAKLVDGMGKPFTVVEEELVRTHIKEDEWLDIDEFIRSFPAEERHKQVWNVTTVKRHFKELQSANETILQGLEDYYRVCKDVAILRDNLTQDAQPQPRQPGESLKFYKARVYDHQTHLLKPSEREIQVKEEARLTTEIAERKGYLVKGLKTTFAITRIVGSEIYCFVNMDPEATFRRYDFEMGHILGYDKATGETLVCAIRKPSKVKRLYLPNFHVRFNPKYGHADTMDEAEFLKQSRRLDSIKKLTKLKREYRAKSRAMLELHPGARAMLERYRSLAT